MTTAPPSIMLMKDRRRQMIPIDKIKVINSRTRDEDQFALNVQSIESQGQLKDIRVNDRFLEKSGWYELICGEGRLIAQKRLGQTEIRAEIVTCTRKQAFLESLVENLARSRSDTLEYARELAALKDEGWSDARIARVACRSEEYVRGVIGLAKNGEDRLVRGVEQGLFPISFAVLVAQSDEANIQNVLMDAFDQSIVGCQNFAKIRAIINARIKGRSRKANGAAAASYTLTTLTNDISATTHEKDSFAREAQGKESRLFLLLDGLAALTKDADWMQIAQEEGLAVRPKLTGTYNVGN
jgi:ParB family chromosome partitioning protein